MQSDFTSIDAMAYRDEFETDIPLASLPFGTFARLSTAMSLAAGLLLALAALAYDLATPGGGAGFFIIVAVIAFVIGTIFNLAACLVAYGSINAWQSIRRTDG